MARLSSAFESRPEPGSILALLEANGSDARHLANTAIGLAQRESLFAANPFYGPEVEPLPVIDYHLLSILINLCRPNLSIKELKRFDYLADSRGFYYRAHHDFEYFYRGLQDVFACGVILDQQKQQLELSGPSKLRELEWNHIARIKNLEEKERVLENLQQRRKAREQCTAWFSAMKLDFINSDMPRLLYVGKHVYQKAHIPDNHSPYLSSAVDPRVQNSSRPVTHLLGDSPHVPSHNERAQIQDDNDKDVYSNKDDCMIIDVDADLQIPNPRYQRDHAEAQLEILEAGISG